MTLDSRTTFRRGSSVLLAISFAGMLMMGLLLAAYFLILDGDSEPATGGWFTPAVATRLGWVMVGLFLIFAAISVMVGIYLVRRFSRIAEAAEKIIATGSLSERLPVDSRWDDLSKLSMVLNRLLQELEMRVIAVKSVSDSIAHDLRTPMTRLRADIEALPAGAQRQDLLNALDNILGIFRSLLRISEIENDKRKQGFRQVDLVGVLRDAYEMFDPIFEAAGITASLDLAVGTAPIFGDRDMLFQAVTNLLDNAAKFVPARGRVQAAVTRTAGGYTLAVADSGPGVMPADRAVALRRFGRLDAARSTAGNGLGLALVKAIADLHAARFDLEDGLPNAAGGRGLGCALSFEG